MIYSIYHPLNGSLNSQCKCNTFMYELVFRIECDSLHEAFTLSQNVFNEDYALLGIRSTSVGDIIQSEEDCEKNECHLVKGIGFFCVPSIWLRFIDHGEVIHVGYIEDQHSN